MDKEREAFENHLKKMGKTDNETFSKNEDDSYQMDIIHFGWKIWQAAIARMEVRINTLDEMLLNQGEALAQAKAQAIPDGYKVVPVNYECVWCGCTELDGWTDETMIEAQEQK